MRHPGIRSLTLVLWLFLAGVAHADGDVLVRMLYNERPTRFEPACQSVRADSFFYRFDELKRCYGYE